MVRLIGLAAGVVCAWAVGLKFRWGYDDSLDVVGVHMFGGIVGALLTGVFADLAVNDAGPDGLLAGGGPALLGKQLIAIATTLTFSLCVTYLILKFVDATIGLRVGEDEGLSGLDLSQHSEASYVFTENGNGSHVLQPAAGGPVTRSVAVLQGDGG